MKIRSKNIFSNITNIPFFLRAAHYPSLDGLRGISIIFVVVSHLNGFRNFLIFNGGLGVDIFFVISGFLITSLLLKEKIKTKSISLKRFYIRRVLRIFPVAYLYLLTLIVLNFFFKLNISAVNLLAAFFYVMNFSYFIKNYHSLLTQHFWSLSVEEQFYLLFPIILKKNLKMFIVLVLFIIFTLPLLIIIQSVSFFANSTSLYAVTHYFIKFQGIAAGCLFSVLAFKNYFASPFHRKYKIWTNSATIVLLCILNYDENYGVKIVFVNLGITILIGYFIVTNIMESKDYIFKFLNSKILSRMGVLSYSIYIWQQLFTLSHNNIPSFVTSFPVNIILLLVVAACSYYLYEIKFLKLKERFNSKAKQAALAAKE